MMKQRKIPMRTCVVTKEKCEKKDLIRIVRTPEGNIDKKILDRIFEMNVSDELFNELNDLLK